jgi:hypothetical protein
LALGAGLMLACNGAGPAPSGDTDAVGGRWAQQEASAPTHVGVELAMDDPTGGDFLRTDPAVVALYDAYAPPVEVRPATPGWGPTRAAMEQAVIALRHQYPERSARSVFAELSDAELAARLPDVQRSYVLELPPELEAARVAELVQRLSLLPSIASAAVVPILQDDVELIPELGDDGEVIDGQGCSPDDPLYCDGEQPYLTRVDAEGAWHLTTGSPSFTAAILDRRLCHRHPELLHQLLPGVNASTGGPALSSCGGTHGDHVAGIVAARTDNGVGMAAFNWDSRILPITVNTRSKAAAIQYAVAGGADAMNFSWALHPSEAAVADAATVAWALGVPFVVAAGNHAREATVARATRDQLTVGGATTALNFGLGVDVHAPAQMIMSLYGEDASGAPDYRQMSGTSMAAPMVTGTLGLLMDLDPSLDLEQLRQALRLRAADLGDPGWDARYTWGFLDAGAAARWAHVPTPPTTVRTPPCAAYIRRPDLEEVIHGSTFDVVGTVGGAARYEIVVLSGLPGSPHAGVAAVDPGRAAGGIVEDRLNAAPLTVPSGGPHTVILRAYGASGLVCGEDRAVVHLSPEPLHLTGFPRRYDVVAAGLFSNAAAGDVTGDGVDDLLVAHNRCSTLDCAQNRGLVHRQAIAYLVEGGAHLGGSGSADLTTAAVSWQEGGNAGLAASMALADVDGDGLDDVVMGYPRLADRATGTLEPGAVCVFLARHRATRWGWGMTTADADYCFEGLADGDRLGGTVENVGDLDGDGRDDVAVAACGDDGAGPDHGAVYLLGTSSSGAWTSGSIASVPGVSRLTGGTPTTADCADAYGEVIPVAGAGDVDGDGVGDLLIGDPRAGGGAGLAVVHRGQLGHLPSGDWAATADWTLFSSVPTTGDRVFGVGDVDGDGLDDLAVRSCDFNRLNMLGYSSFAAGCGRHARLDVIHGRPDPGPLHLVLDADADATLRDVDHLDYVGQAVVGGDFDGDGYGDLTISTPFYGAYRLPGMVWTVRGGPAGVPSGVLRDVAEGSFKPAGYAAGDWTLEYQLGLGLDLAAGDFDGDGRLEIWTNASAVTDLGTNDVDYAHRAGSWILEPLR